jgi:predicted DCC family thiol-disulfide oxidoreductase YuxK
MSGPVLLFDGTCNLCNGTIRFVLARERGPELRFAALQSAFGRASVAPLGPAARDLSTFVLLDGGKAYFRSDAALRVARHLRFPWPLLAWFLVIPRPLRDAAYSFVARNRYRWFGRSELCLLPDPSLRARFLD